MTLNHNCGYFSGVGSGIAGNVYGYDLLRGKTMNLASTKRL